MLACTQLPPGGTRRLPGNQCNQRGHAFLSRSSHVRGLVATCGVAAAQQARVRRVPRSGCATWAARVAERLPRFQEHLVKMQKQKLQLPQQAPPPQAPAGPPPPSAQVQVQPPPPAQQPSPQLTTVTASRPGALLTGTTVANLQVARLVSPLMVCLSHAPARLLLAGPKVFWWTRESSRRCAFPPRSCSPWRGESSPGERLSNCTSWN